MSPITRSWVAFAAVGAGLIHLALVISAPTFVGILFAVVGVAEFGWGVLVVFDGRFLAPRIAVIAVLAPIALWIAALVTALDPGAFRPFPLAVATLLELFIAVAIGLSLRRGGSAKVPSTGRLVIGLVAGALVIGALAAPALGATEAGQFVAPAGSFDEDGHH